LRLINTDTGSRDLARRLGCRVPRGLRGGGGFARSRDGIELRLQLGLGGVPLHLQLCDPGCPYRKLNPVGEQRRIG